MRDHMFEEYFTAAIAVGAAGFALAVILVIALLLKKRRTKGRLVLDSASYDHFKMHNIIAE
jgi:nitrate reductase gamma subunit